MNAMQKTDCFATLPRRPNAVIADACRNAHTAIIDDPLSASVSIKQHRATRFIHLSVQGTAKSGCTSQPSVLLKSP